MSFMRAALAAIAPLNESSNAYFYLFKLEAIKIDESNHAPLFTLIVGKSQEQDKEKIPERDNIRHEFWDSLIKVAGAKTDLHAKIAPSSGSYISAGAGKTGLYYQYDILMHSAKVELYIDGGNKRRNKK